MRNLSEGQSALQAWSLLHLKEDTLCVCLVEDPSTLSAGGCSDTPLISSSLLHCIWQISRQARPGHVVSPPRLLSFGCHGNVQWSRQHLALVRGGRRKIKRSVPEGYLPGSDFLGPFSPSLRCESSLFFLFFLPLHPTLMNDSDAVAVSNIQWFVFKDVTGDIMWILWWSIKNASPRIDALCLHALVSIHWSSVTALYSEQRRGGIKELSTNKGSSIMWWNSLWCIVIWQ